MQRNKSEWIWQDADMEPSDEQLAQLMRIVRDEVLEREKKTDALFAGMMQKELAREEQNSVVRSKRP